MRDDLLRAVMASASAFSEAGRDLYLDFHPDIRRWSPITDLVGRVRLGVSFMLPDGRELVCEVRLVPRGQAWHVEGTVDLDGEELLHLPEAPEHLIGLYTEQVLEPARRHLDEAVTGLANPG
ncbi:hypothetical protein [Herbidospora cretacea]|uniref:hypothetical protein n=1 Tax=Herbidospora cretacea TaxID=28444 RepID=UPI0007740E7E|nr:hypothetical protein [Herbidospora cretacea]